MNPFASVSCKGFLFLVTAHHIKPLNHNSVDGPHLVVGVIVRYQKNEKGERGLLSVFFLSMRSTAT